MKHVLGPGPFGSQNLVCGFGADKPENLNIKPIIHHGQESPGRISARSQKWLLKVEVGAQNPFRTEISTSPRRQIIKGWHRRLGGDLQQTQSYDPYSRSIGRVNSVMLDPRE